VDVAGGLQEVGELVDCFGEGVILLICGAGHAGVGVVVHEQLFGVVVLVLASFFLLDIFDVAAAEFYFEESGGTVEVICCFVFLYFAGV
jgi:hypothetical protein